MISQGQGTPLGHQNYKSVMKTMWGYKLSGLKWAELGCLGLTGLDFDDFMKDCRKPLKVKMYILLEGGDGGFDLRFCIHLDTTNIKIFQVPGPLRA